MSRAITSLLTLTLAIAPAGCLFEDDLGNSELLDLGSTDVGQGKADDYNSKTIALYGSWSSGYDGTSRSSFTDYFADDYLFGLNVIHAPGSEDWPNPDADYHVVAETILLRVEHVWEEEELCAYEATSVPADLEEGLRLGLVVAYADQDAPFSDFRPVRLNTDGETSVVAFDKVRIDGSGVWGFYRPPVHAEDSLQTDFVKFDDDWNAEHAPHDIAIFCVPLETSGSLLGDGEEEGRKVRECIVQPCSRDLPWE